MNEFFRKFAYKSAEVLGTSWAFITALTIIILWAIAGPVFGFSDTWQLVINTGTTIITFLMVFLIQNTQNRDAKEIHLKLDELISSIREARTGIIDLENASDEELKLLRKEFKQLSEDESRDPRQSDNKSVKDEQAKKGGK